MTHARDCCCDSDPPTDWACDGPEYPCLRATLGGFSEADCIGSSCWYFPGFGPVFPSDSRGLRVEGYSGSHLLRPENGWNSLKYGTIWAERANNTEIQGIVCEAFSITVSLGCDLDTNRLIYTAVRVTSESGGGGAGCTDGILFSWGAVDGDIRFVSDGLSLGPGDNNIPQDCSRHPLTHGGNVSVQAMSCPPAEDDLDTRIAVGCQNKNDKITVDMADRPGNHQWCIFNEKKYRLNGEQSQDPAVVVEWSRDPCPDDPPADDNRIAVLCRGLDQIVYDPADIVTFSRTCVWEGRRYKLTDATTNQPALPVIFSSRNCQGFDFPDCTGINSPDDPRCQDPIFMQCPRCFDSDPVDPPDPFPESPNASAGDDDDLDPGRLPGLGDMVARALELIRLDKLASPNKCGCKRRQAILNEWGERYGRAIIKRLGL